MIKKVNCHRESYDLHLRLILLRWVRNYGSLANTVVGSRFTFLLGFAKAAGLPEPKLPLQILMIALPLIPARAGAGQTIAESVVVIRHDAYPRKGGIDS